MEDGGAYCPGCLSSQSIPHSFHLLKMSFKDGLRSSVHSLSDFRQVTASLNLSSQSCLMCCPSASLLA